MASFLQVSQVIAGLILIASVLFQQIGTGLGGAFGGEGATYRSRRGVEKLLFRTTILFGAFFLVVSIAQLFV